MRPTFTLVLLLACSTGGQDKDCQGDDCTSGGSTTDSDPDAEPSPDSSEPSPTAEWGQVVLGQQALAAGTVTGSTHTVRGSLTVGQQAASSPTYSVVGRVTLVRP